MKQKTGHPAFDQGIQVFMETIIYRQGILIHVYCLKYSEYPVAIFQINWKGLFRIFTDRMTKRMTVFAGMTMDDIAAFKETGDKPLGYDG